MGSSWTRDWTRVLCIGRQIVIHWTTKEVPQVIFSFEQMALLLTFVPLFGLHLQRCYWPSAVNHWWSVHWGDDHGCLTYMARFGFHKGRKVTCRDAWHLALGWEKEKFFKKKKKRQPSTICRFYLDQTSISSVTEFSPIPAPCGLWEAQENTVDFQAPQWCFKQK